MTNIDFKFNDILKKIRFNSWKCFFLTKMYNLQTTTPTYISFRSQSFLTSPYCRLMNVQNTNLQKLVTKQVSPNSTTRSFDTCVHSFIRCNVINTTAYSRFLWKGSFLSSYLCGPKKSCFQSSFQNYWILKFFRNRFVKYSVTRNKKV